MLASTGKIEIGKRDSEVSLSGTLFTMSGRCSDHYYHVYMCNVYTALMYSEIIQINVLFFAEDDFLSCCMESSRSFQDEAFISKEVREG